ncbi:uncharacterized protein A4U43_C04F5100 [Asparagus officinalis]|uniref:Myb-like domain-containing protein n=1 Tax=Asparagus officinalis TaxID=4686 RepID=A0A5P1EYD5_ASPOF|nr:trihelix transcription factor GT-1-like [Asparagus officinalis]ONK71138.1 uncharacterized protein A4U43_C04F5100 [Asparagus officinalis]
MSLFLAIDQLFSSSLLKRREEDQNPNHLLEASKAMYLSEKPRPLDFYKEEEEGRDMMIEVVGNGQHPMILAESSGEDPEIKAPKKRAETWVQEETRSLIGLRREMDGLFNTSKSNKHLWEQISAKMRDKGFDRSPTMCTDKWRNLLKEFKKAKHQCKGSGSAKMSYYKELDELLKERNKNATYKSPAAAKVDSFMQFADKGLEDAGIPYTAVEGTGRSPLNLERRLDHEGHPLAITSVDATASGVPPWNWRDTPTNGGENQAPYGGRVLLVKWGEYTKKIGVDGTAEAIKEAIKSAFGLRTQRAFWLEDEDEVVRCLDREMPIGTYSLHLDDGVTIKVCTYVDNAVSTEDKTFYTGEDFRDFLSRNNWISLRELNGFRSVVTLDDLRQGEMYQGVRLLEE